MDIRKRKTAASGTISSQIIQRVHEIIQETPLTHSMACQQMHISNASFYDLFVYKKRDKCRVYIFNGIQNFINMHDEIKALKMQKLQKDRNGNE